MADRALRERATVRSAFRLSHARRSLLRKSARMPAVMIEVLQRFTWNGEPKELDDFFHLTKNRRLARAVIFTHQFGWELRLLVGSQKEAHVGRRSVAPKRRCSATRRAVEGRDDREGLEIGSAADGQRRGRARIAEPDGAPIVFKSWPYLAEEDFAHAVRAHSAVLDGPW